MNAERRKRIEELKSSIEGLKADAEALQQEEQDAYDNTPESLRGDVDYPEHLQSAVDALEEAFNSLEECTQ